MSGRGGPSFWIAAAIGWAVIAFGVVGLIDRVGTRGALDVATWVVGGNVVHDVLVAPLVFAIGAGLAVAIPRPWRAPIAAGLAASAIAVAVGYPALRGFGRKPNNPSLLPLDYGTAVLTVLAVVWGAVVVWEGILLVGRRPGRQSRTTRGRWEESSRRDRGRGPGDLEARQTSEHTIEDDLRRS